MRQDSSATSEQPIGDLLDRAESLGYLVVCLPGMDAHVVAPGGRGDDALVAEIVSRSVEIEAQLPTEREAKAWLQLRRDERARRESRPGAHA